ncbi:hypothetical protein [Arsukibacterium sp.]|uniref:hypothetical protein n=1 Tax=Arsukibacterium sp. TaxID=1977258 RepID=UPI001BD63211|nr:hypothetical protein [Arsukibacterium sp.]
MAIADNQWPLFYQGLQHVKQLASSATVTPDIAAALEQSKQLTSLFISIAEQHSTSIIAQLNLTPRHLAADLVRVVKMLALGLILSRGYGWQLRRSQQFLQALLMAEVLAPQTSNRLPARINLVKALQQFDKQHPLLPLLIASCNTQRQPAWQQHPDAPLLSLLSQLAQQLLPATGNQPGLEKVLNKYQVSRPDSVNSSWFCQLQQLAERQALPGRFAKEIQSNNNSPNYWFICGVAPAQDGALAVYVRPFDPGSKTIGSEVQQLPMATLALLSPQYFRDLSWLILLEPDDNLLPAPAEHSLESCLSQSQFDQLSQLSITKQVEILAAQPLLSQFLQQAAGSISRQQLPVNRLRHAITMLGQDALRNWVAQAELHQYCLRQAHPHQLWLQQLQHCLEQALLLLCNATNQPLTAGSAGVVARCATASLWQHPALAQTALARHIQQQLVLGVHIQQHVWQAQHYPQHVQQLLQHYRQPDWSEAMQSWHSQQPAKLAVMLKLSWQLTLAVFCAGSVNEQRLTAMLPTACARLKLPVHPPTYWQEQLITASQCYYPLPEM